MIGAGVFGAWTARFLAEAGHQVLLLDAYGPANGRASSCDHSRVIRAGYGSDDIYSRWATDSLPHWKRLAGDSGLELFTPAGALFLGEPGNTYIEATRQTLGRLNIAAETLDPEALRARYPQINIEGLGTALLERDAGVLRARDGVHALVRTLLRNRQVRYIHTAVEPLDEQRASFDLRATGAPLERSDAYVFACGPWLPRLFPRAVGDRIRPTRQEVLYFGTPPGGTARFGVSRLPVWIDFQAGYYGIPDVDAHGFKLGVDRHGPLVDPDTLDRTPDPGIVARAREWMAHRFPGLRGAPLVDARVCQYENTSSGDFLIDRHPQWPECWIAGGGSGHGFKHGPAVGRHVAALVTGKAGVEPRFSFSVMATKAARAVY